MKMRIRRMIQGPGSDPHIGTRWALAVGAAALCLTVGVAVAQQRPAGPEPMDPPPGPGFKVEHKASVREVREQPGIDRQRIAMKRLIEQLSQQAAEKKAMLGESRDLSPEERQIREIEFQLLTQQIAQMESHLEALGREPPEPRKSALIIEKRTAEPDFGPRFDSLRQKHDELVQRAQKLERELAELKDDQNPDADELKMHLKEVHGQMVDVEKRMDEQKRGSSGSSGAPWRNRE